jgi:hypothetical protein
MTYPEPIRRSHVSADEIEAALAEVRRQFQRVVAEVERRAGDNRDPDARQAAFAAAAQFAAGLRELSDGDAAELVRKRVEAIHRAEMMSLARLAELTNVSKSRADQLVNRFQAQPRRVGPIYVDPSAEQVRVNNRAVTVTDVELRLLAALTYRPGVAYLPATLYAEVFGAGPKADDDAADTVAGWVASLRRKLGRTAGRMIQTTRQGEYVLAVGELADCSSK